MSELHTVAHVPVVAVVPSRRAAVILRTIAVVGVVIAIAGTIVVWQFLGDLDRNTERSLIIGEDAAVTLTETIDVADQLVTSLDGGLSTLESTLRTVDDAVRSTEDLAASTGSLASTLPESFDEIDSALAAVESLGETVDSTLSALSSVPFGPDYDPAVPFPDAIAELRRAFDPIGDDLRSISAELGAFGDDSESMRDDIDSLAADITGTREALAGTQVLLDQYRTTAEDARDLAATSRSDLSTSMAATRWVVIAVGLLIAISQYVPWTLADSLRPPSTLVVREQDGAAGSVDDSDDAAEAELADRVDVDEGALRNA